MMKKRNFTKEENLKIIKEAAEKGVNETLEKHGLYHASYYDWKKKFWMNDGVFYKKVSVSIHKFYIFGTH